MKKIIPVIGLLLVFCMNDLQHVHGEEISARNPYPLDQTPKLKKNTTNDEFRLDSILSYRWDGEANVWEPSHFLQWVGGNYLYAAWTIYRYDESGNMVTCYEPVLDFDNNWFVYRQFEYTYNEAGNQTMMNGSNYYASEQNRVKGDYFYDERGNLTEALHYEWDSTIGDWIPNTIQPKGWDYATKSIHSAKRKYPTKIDYADKVIYNYDENDNITSKIKYDWDAIQEDWVFKSKTEYTYDENNNLTTAIYFSWDLNLSDWVYCQSSFLQSLNSYNESGKNIFTYSQNAELKMVTGYNFDTLTNDWVNSYKSEFTFDNNIFTEIGHFWDETRNDWYFFCKDEYTFDDNDNYKSRIHYRWDEDNKDWYVKGKLDYYYSRIEQTTDNADLERYASICKVFPNPTSGALTIEVHESLILSIELFSMNGQLLFNSQVEDSNHQLDLSSFQPGIYFITIRSKDFVTTRKIIKL